MVNLAIIEDDANAGQALQTYFISIKGFNHVQCFDGVESFLTDCSIMPDAVLLDIELTGMTGLAGCFLIKQRFSKTNIIMLTMHDNKELVFKALQAGACGYLLKSTPLAGIEAAVHEALAGGAPMTPGIARKVITFFTEMPETKKNIKLEQLTKREVEVAQLLMAGNTYKQVAWHLKISTDTVRQHIKNMYSKLEINSRVQLINEFKNN